MRVSCLLRLLEDTRALEEIERYKWIESERLGWDIGEKRATLEWVSAYGCNWLRVHRRDKYQIMLEEICKEEQEADRKMREAKKQKYLMMQAAGLAQK